jgi:hypothetical protein
MADLVKAGDVRLETGTSRRRTSLDRTSLAPRSPKCSREGISTAMRRWCAHYERPHTQDLVETWWDGLSDYEDEVINEAMRAAIRECRFPARVAEVLEHCRAITARRLNEAMQAAYQREQERGRLADQEQRARDDAMIEEFAADQFGGPLEAIRRVKRLGGSYPMYSIRLERGDHGSVKVCQASDFAPLVARIPQQVEMVTSLLARFAPDVPVELDDQVAEICREAANA